MSAKKYYNKILLFISLLPACALGDEWTEDKFTDVGGVSGMTGPSGFGQLLGAILLICRLIGCGLFAWSLLQLGLSVKNDDAESKSRATGMMVASICMIGMLSIYNAITS